MADTRITDLSAITGASVATGDLAVVVDVSDTSMAGSGTDKKLTVAEFGTALVAVGLPASGVTAATYGDATHTAQVTVDAKGRVTGASNVTITGTAPGGTAGGDLSGTYPNPTVESAPIGFTVGSPVLGSGYGINSTTGIATEQASLGLLFYGTQWAGAATIDLRRINGTSGSPAALASGDVIGGMHIGASWTTANSDLDDVAQIYCVATENYAVNATGNRWDFYVNKNSSGVRSATSKTVGFRIDQDGSLAAGFGTYGAVTSATFTVSNVGAVTAASGTIGPVTIAATTGNVAAVGTFATTNNWTQTRSAGVPQILIRRDDAAATAVNVNVGQLVMGGVTAASTFINTASIAAVSESAYVSANNAPTQLRFMSTSASSSLVNRMILDASGSLHLAPTVASGLVTTANFAVKNDGSVWVAPTAYSSNQPSAAPVKLDSTGIILSASDIATDTTTGTKIGTGTTQKLGFFNATPIVRGTAFTQTYSTATHTHANVTASNPPAGGTGATAGAYDTAANRNLMITSLTNNIADVANVKQVLNGLIDDLQALGLIA